MAKRLGYTMASLLLILIAALQSAAPRPATAADVAINSSSQAARTNESSQGNLFVQRNGNVLKLNGQQFRFAGSNNYYPMYKSQFMVDDVFNAAAGNGFRVMRVWGSLDIGNQDGSNSIRGKADGVYFQYWGGSAPAYNDGADGLQHLDYVIYRAGKLGLKLVIPFVNNWNDFGGMDQYVRWRDSSTPDDQVWYHDSFYTDPVIRQWYKNWIAHLLNRVNTYNGVAYKNDPTIMTWELGNEPRCLSAGAYPRSNACTTQTLTAWANEMSTYIKSVDHNHLVSVGDEGFYCLPNPTHWTDSCSEGVDTIALTRLANIDVMSLHLYPDYWGRDASWGTDWIKRHIRDAKANGKAVMLGEWGWLDKSTRNKVYKAWTDALFKSGGQSGADGGLYWLLSARQDNGTLYPDYDGFTVYAGTPVSSMLGHFAQMMAANRGMTFPPVADDDTAVVEFNTGTTLNPPANDVTYGGATLKVSSIDLDPSAAGQQTTKSVAGGTFEAHTDGRVAFTPTQGVSGLAQITYTIKDSSARTSNAATLAVTVKPDPTATILLASFETGTEGAGPAGGTGTVSQSPAFSTNGTFSLEINVTSEGWFRVAALAPPVDVSQKTAVKLDLQTLGNQTYRKLSIQVGDNFTWCEQNGGDGNTPANTVATISLDLTNMACSGADLTKLQIINIYLQPGTFRIDSVRAE
jgi:mannan endo-1,4-beta-mannosidase